MKRGFLNGKTKNSTEQGKAMGTSTKQELVPMTDKLVKTGGVVTKLDSGRISVTLPIGKLDSTIPEHYVAQQMQFGLGHGLDTEYSDDAFVFSTIPPRPMSDIPAVGPNTWAECLFKGGKPKRVIFSISNFPELVPEPLETRHRVGPSAHGLGMFATKDLVPNDLILAERPLLVAPLIMDFQIPPHPDNLKLSPAQCVRAHLAEVEKLLQVCVNRLDPEDREAFFELHDCHTEDGSGPIYGRVRTNGIGINIGETGEQEKESYSGIFQITSRINHSCTPNVSYFFDLPSFSLRLHAIRPISAGEELLINYISISKPTAKRQEKLRPYGFQCTCNACTDPNWDVRLSCIVKSCEKPATEPPEAVIKNSLRWIKIIEDAKLEALNEYFVHLTAVVELSTVLGRRDAVREYVAKGKAWASATSGKSMLLFSF